MSKLTGLSIGYLSELERGRKVPTPATAAMIEEALGMVPAPAPAPSVVPVSTPASTEDGPVAWLGACLAVTREARLVDLAKATDLTVAGVQQTLRRLSATLAPTGIRVLDDGMVASLQPRQGFGRFVSALVRPKAKPALTQLQAAIVMMAVYREGLSVADVTNLRGVESWKVMQTLVDKGYLARVAHGDGEVMYQPTFLILEMTKGVETFDELRALLGSVAEATTLDEILRPQAESGVDVTVKEDDASQE